MLRQWMKATGLMLLTTLPVLGQEGYQVEPINSKPESSMLEWGIGTLFLIGCLVVAFKPSKRSNLK